MIQRPDPHVGADGYDPVAVSLHWLLAVLIVASFFVGLYMVDLHFSPLRFRLFNWHKWAGMAVLVLSIVRLVWRAAGHPAPALPAGVPRWQIGAYRATHLAFYGLFFVVPVLGWLYTSAVGVPVVWFGWLPLPDLWPSTIRWPTASSSRCTPSRPTCSRPSSHSMSPRRSSTSSSTATI